MTFKLDSVDKYVYSMLMLETIRTDKLLNIIIAIISILLIGIWYVAHYDIILYAGIGFGIYWSIFCWLQLATPPHLAKSKVYKSKSKLKIWTETRKNRLSLHQRLRNESNIALVRDLLISHIKFSILKTLFAAYCISVVALFVFLFGAIMNWMLWLSVGICGTYLIISILRVVYYSLELRGLRKDLMKESQEIKKKLLRRDYKFLEDIIHSCEELSHMQRVNKALIETSLDLSTIEHEEDDA